MFKLSKKIMSGMLLAVCAVVPLSLFGAQNPNMPNNQTQNNPSQYAVPQCKQNNQVPYNSTYGSNNPQNYENQNMDDQAMSTDASGISFGIYSGYPYGGYYSGYYGYPYGGYYSYPYYSSYYYYPSYGYSYYPYYGGYYGYGHRHWRGRW